MPTLIALGQNFPSDRGTLLPGIQPRRALTVINGDRVDIDVSYRRHEIRLQSLFIEDCFSHCSIQANLIVGVTLDQEMPPLSNLSGAAMPQPRVQTAGVDALIASSIVPDRFRSKRPLAPIRPKRSSICRWLCLRAMRFFLLIRLVRHLLQRLNSLMRSLPGRIGCARAVGPGFPKPDAAARWHHRAFAGNSKNPGF